MSVRNGSASDADCQISEDCSVPDVELMELGPLLEEGGGRQVPSKGVHPEVRLFCFFYQQFREKLASCISLTVGCSDHFEGSTNAC